MFDKALFGLPGIRGVLAALGLLAAVQAAAIIGQALTLARALANLWGGSPVDTQLGLVTAFLGCFLAKNAVTLAQDALLSRYAAGQAASLRGRLLEKAFSGPAGWVRAHGTAGVTTSALEGIDQVENYLRVILPKVIGAAVILPATLVTAFSLDWPSGVILLAVLPVTIFYMVMLGRMAQDRAAAQYGTYQVLSNHFIDTLRGLPTLKAFGAAKRHTAEVFEVSERFREATMKTLRVATLSSAVLDLLATLGVAAVAMLLGFRLVDGSLPLFTGLAALIIAPEYFAPLREFAGDFHASLDGRNALAGIMRLIGGDAGDAPAEPEPAMGRWDAGSTLSLSGIGFSYPPDAGDEAGLRALRDVSFEVRGFERIGIVGASGSGKSTLANLMGGFIAPGEGSLSLDGVPLPLQALQDAAWQSQVHYIPQDPYLFHATLRDNIAFYTPDATEADIRRAVDVVGLAPLVEELPEGLGTVIGEGGRALSGGQAQRIALARALLDSGRRILIFDEPTAHLDIETELELKGRMLPLMEDRLVIFATHRLHWLEDMDRILVMEDGRLSEAVPKAPAEGPASRPPVECAPAGAGGSPVECGSSSSPSGPPSDGAAARDGHPRRDTWVRPYFRRYRRQLARALGLGVGAFAFSALLMFMAGYLISATAEAPGSILFYYLPIAFVQVFGLGKPLLRYFERLSSHDWVFRMTSSLRVRLYKALERQALEPGTRSTGEVLGLVAEDIGHIQNLYLRTVFPLVIAWALYLIVIVALGFSSPWFALAMFVALGIVTVAVPLASALVNRARMERHKALKNDLYEGLADDMLGASDWVFAGRGAHCRQSQADRARAAHAQQERLDRYARWNDFAVAALMGAIACLVLWWAAGRFGGAAGGSANWIAAFVLGFFPLIEAFAPLSAAATQANVFRDSIDRLNAFPETDDSLGCEETATVPAEGCDLDIDAVGYRYPGTRRPVLDAVSLRIPAGQRVAVLGRSGSGKSTLASLVRGDIAPDAGSVTLGGVPTPDFGDAIAQRIGVVQQRAYLFNRPLRENLAIGKPDASDEEIWRVLEQVRLAGMVRRLPQGLDTLVDEAGMRFSGGERHRIALARVLLADPPVILLDEPTVGLDPATEQGVLDTLLQATRGKTLVMVTHHLQGIEAFDRVVFLEDGRIELDGSPAQLARTSERYRRLLAFDRGGRGLDGKAARGGVQAG